MESKLNGESTKTFLRGEGSVNADEISRNWIRHIEDDDMLASDRPYEGALDSLRKLNELKHDIYLVTARRSAIAAQSQVKSHGMEEYIKFVGVVSPGLAAGEEKAALLASLPIDVVVGDTESDQEWADCMGARFIAVDWGFRSNDYWLRKNVKAVSTYGELYNELGG